MDSKAEKLIKLVHDAGVIRPAELAQKLGVSVRTVRTYVKRANSALVPMASIVLERGRGYRIVESGDASSYSTENVLSKSSNNPIPSTREQRISYLIDDLLSRDDWITIDKLSQILFISRRTISDNLKEVEQILEPFGLVLERRPRYGVRVTGSEMGRRLCLAHRAMKNLHGEDEALFSDETADVSIDIVAECVEQGLKGYDLHVRTASFQNLLVHIAVAVMRIKHGMYVPMQSDEIGELQKTPEYPAAESIAHLIEERFRISLPREEIAYIAIHLAGKQILSAPEDQTSGIEISDDIWDIVSQMLELVYSTFRFDFREDIELRMNLARHIVPLATRLRFHMELKNPMLDDVRARFPLAYTIARHSSSVIEDAYDTELSDDEVAYLAFAFALALERQKTERPKKNIAIVCASGVGSARLLEYRCREEFGPYLGTIITCDVREVAQLDYSHIDYVFTTVPLGIELPVPVRRVEFFLDEDNIHEVRHLFESDDVFPIQKFIPKKLFIAHRDYGSRHEAISELCGLVASVDALPDDFEESIWQREESMSTAFGNQIAIPHPIEPVGTRTLVAVALLDAPLEWGSQEVRIIMLISIARENHGDINGLYERISRLLVSKEAIKALLEEQTYSKFIELMTRGE